MEKILVQVSSYLFMVAVAYFLKRKGVVKEEDGKALGEFLMRVTLPCAILAGFRGFVLDKRYLLLSLVGAFGNLMTVALGFLLARKDIEKRKLYMLGMSGYNVGNFALPFASSFIGAAGIVACSLFDIGNCLMCIGVNMSLTIMATEKDNDLKFSTVVVDLLKRPAFTIYIFILLFLLPGIPIPEFLFSVAENVGKANGPLAMFMLGVMLEVNFRKEYMGKTLAIVLVRMGTAILLALGVSVMSFLPYELKKAAMMIAFAPVASCSTAYVAELKGDAELCSFASTITMILAMIILPTLSLVL